jgi:hypothetical protein
MTEVTLVDGVETALVGAKKARKASVSYDAFVAAVKAGSLATPKLTGSQVAEQLGMEKGSFDQRLLQLRKDYVTLQENGTIAKNEDGTLKPFPLTLADGRSVRDGESTKGATAKNAILAALADLS